jgi:hypothetical protein
MIKMIRMIKTRIKMEVAMMMIRMKMGPGRMEMRMKRKKKRMERIKRRKKIRNYRLLMLYQDNLLQNLSSPLYSVKSPTYPAQ